MADEALTADEALISLEYPASHGARNRWISSRRGPKNTLDPNRAYGAFVEDEPGPDGAIWDATTILLTNRECAFRCLMCDLWRDTLDAKTEIGAIPAQIDDALATLSLARSGRKRALKLYNAGSFFDLGQIPESDLPEIAARARHFDRVIVECHPAFLRGKFAETALAFRDGIAPATLEVAIGLECASDPVLEKLNKRMTVADFTDAAAFLARNEIALRVFLLVRPPFLSEVEGVEWACRSLDLALDSGATFCALLPTRSGNGALNSLAKSGDFSPPTLESVEECLRHGLARKRGRVQADLWEIERFVKHDGDRERIERIARANRTQAV